MEHGLRIDMTPYDVDMHDVQVEVSNGNFRGTAHLYVGGGELPEAAGVLAGFPAHSQDSRRLEWGTFGPHAAGGALEVVFSCADPQGHVVVTVRLESDPAWSGGPEQLSLFFQAEAWAIDEFVTQLRALDGSKAGHAMLKGCPR